ncbi:MAG TPA: SBBP repeat-containing protein [Burkholderiales bacterium]|jgi:hypothetical protein|nr:SBBP repeat-containing protein [Burkholderiales bacterium]
MSRSTLIPSRRLLTLFTFLLSLAGPHPAAADSRVSEGYGKLPLHFEANQGQTHEDVRFLARGSGYSLYLTSGEAVFVLIKASPDKKSDWHRKHDWRSEQERPKVQGVVLRMAIVGAAPAPLVSGLDELSGKANYFIGNDPAKWRTNVSTYAKVHYREVYPGIDLVYYGNQRQLEYDFIVAPGADPGYIVLSFQGADRLEVKAEGELVLHLAGRAVRQKKPVIHQEIDGVRREIAGGYVLQGANQVGFEVAAYDRSRPLIIDPVVLSYSTYLGGSDREGGSGIAVDVDGNAYVTGQTSSLNFPTTAGAFQTSAGADCTPQFPCLNAFVTKLNPTGSALIYSTYVGGSSTNSAGGVAVDSDGNAYVMGTTGSIDFPTTIGAFQPIHGGGYDAFVTKLNSTGSALLYSTYLGGNGYGDWGHGIAVDVDGNAYVTGETMSNNFPTTPGAFQTVIGGGGSCGSPESPSPCNDAFVTKLNPAGSALVYSTYLGGRPGEWGNGIAVDASGSAYVTGWTSSYTDFPTTVGAFQMTGNSWDAFVTKLHPTGSSLIYSTHLGGSDDGRAGSGGGYGSGKEQGYGIAVDVDGNAYVTGETTSIDFPTTAGAFQPAFGGGRIDGGDAFVAKLNPTGSSGPESHFDWKSGMKAEGKGCKVAFSFLLLSVFVIGEETITSVALGYLAVSGSSRPASLCQNCRTERMGMPSISRSSSSALSPVTKTSVRPAIAHASIGISSGSLNDRAGNLFALTTSPSDLSKPRKPLITWSGRRNFCARTRSSSCSTGSHVSSSCSLKTPSINSAHRPRAARPLANTLVSRKTLTRRRGRRPRQSGSPPLQHRAWLRVEVCGSVEWQAAFSGHRGQARFSAGLSA